MAVGPGDVTTVGLQLVADSFTSPVLLTEPQDGSGRLFVVDQSGVIRIIRNGQLLPEPFLDIRDELVALMPTFDERGLLGLAFHPNFQTNGHFYIYFNTPLRPGAPAGYDNTARLSELTVTPGQPDLADRSTERVLLEIDDPQPTHNGGTLAFGPDGFLYLSLGDGGGANDVGFGHSPMGNAQDVNELWGSILRIDINQGDPYAIPFDNPFVAGGGAPEIYAWGFRNPYRMSFDTAGTKALYAGDVGQDLFEEVDVVVRGGNYGWNLREGFHCFDPNAPQTPPATCADTGALGDALLLPVLEYGKATTSGGLGVAVIGGFIYRGMSLPGLAGRYVFGDYSSSTSAPMGRLFVAGRSPVAGDPWQLRELDIAQRQGTNLNAFLLGFGQGQNGEIYVLTNQTGGPQGATGRVYRLVPEPEGGPDPVATGTP